MNPNNIQHSLDNLRDREERIGMSRSLLDLLFQRSNGEHKPSEEAQSVPRPVVSMKTLYSDFQVRELSLFANNGEPLRLLQLPPLAEPQSLSSTSARKDAERVGTKREREEAPDNLPEESETKDGTAVEGKDARAPHVVEALSHLIDATDLTNLLNGIQAETPRIALSSVTDKALRTRVHQVVKATLGTTHVSSTENGVVVVVKATAADRREERRRSNPIRLRKFLHFTLYKENIDSNQVFRMLSKYLNISTRQFQFSGTKDKRAVTLQRVAIRDMPAGKLAQVNQRSFGPQSAVKVSDFAEEDFGLRLGDAAGNHFAIALRILPSSPVVPDLARLEQLEDSLRAVGAINYFGPQRFGTTAVLTSDVGVQLLKGNFEKALATVMASKACIVPEMKAVLPHLEARDFAAAMAAAPYYCFQERDMLRHLVQCPNDFQGAFQTISRTLAMLYFHAVQSLVWNRMVSRRLSDPSRVKPEVGDLVLEAVYHERMALQDATAVVNLAAYLKESEAGQSLPAVRLLSADDRLECFALSDVLLPVPGPDKDLQYPTSRGCSKAAYVEEIEQLGVEGGLLRETNPLVKLFHFHGTYRPICVRPERVRLELRAAPSWRAPVLPTDLEILEGKELEVGKNEASHGEHAASSVSVLVAHFSLPPGCYATSVLREFALTCTEDFHNADSRREDEGESREEV